MRTVDGYEAFPPGAGPEPGGGAGRLAEAQAHLNAVTNEMYADLKKTLTRSLNEKEVEAKSAATNAPPSVIP